MKKLILIFWLLKNYCTKMDEFYKNEALDSSLRKDYLT